ncbi:DUF1345 domain-containing protein [Spirosoma taeanense]|uniref:DUF1345 domain-containing protein n=1 Tax=Spirosoma taeanense TaxID=2735870 RepID=A0A6M5Y6G3_9BACT|nr:DUF1345 domain-containing protein [Spirosoma taeanense]QJW88643.1 DUF1345 domain-containing protein [Spirosoma taeanense]
MLLDQTARLDAHHRLYIAFGVTLGTYFILPAAVSGSAQVVLLWVVFALIMLTLMWASIFRLHPRDLPKLSRLQDSSRTYIFLFIVVAAIASFFAIIELLDTMTQQGRRANVGLTVLAVICSWGLLHTVFTLRYAHLFYGDNPNQKSRPGGLDFPNETEPDYLDFAYFSFVIGMTSQVSDVTIRSKQIRRAALLHGILSFGFNAIIIALTISGLSSRL